MSWFTGWEPLVRAVLFAAIAYVALIALVRVLGFRTIAKMNPGDFVVTVAVGHIAASVILDTEISLAQGLTALVALLGLQFLSEWASTRWPKLRHAADGKPVMLAYDGQLLLENMTRENIDREDVLAAAREHGIGRMRDIHAVVLEIDGQLSVIAARDAGDDTLEDVRRAS